VLELIRDYPGMLPAALCEEIMARFDADPRRHSGATGSPETGGSNDAKIKLSTDLHVTQLASVDETWQQYEKALTTAYLKAVRSYAEDVHSTRYLSGTMGSTGFQIQCYPQGSGHYVEHIDADTYEASVRVLSGVIYLNTVEEGGGTNFPYQDRLIKPVQGSIVVFPSNYAFPHEALTPLSSPKYIVATWFGFVRSDSSGNEG